MINLAATYWLLKGITAALNTFSLYYHWIHSKSTLFVMVCVLVGALTLKINNLTSIDSTWNNLILYEKNKYNFLMTERDVKTQITDLSHSARHKAAADLHNIMIILDWGIFKNKHEQWQGRDGNLGVWCWIWCALVQPRDLRGLCGNRIGWLHRLVFTPALFYGRWEVQREERQNLCFSWQNLTHNWKKNRQNSKN